MNDIEPDHALFYSSPSTLEGDNTHSVLLDAVHATVRIDGLSEPEAETLLRCWTRCNARLATDYPETIPQASMFRSPNTKWIDFHEHLVGWVTREAISSGRGELFMFHAAAISLPETGASLVLVAESGTGKTTATRVLAKEFGYVTDETAAFGGTRELVPYPKPLSLLPENNQRPKTQFSPDEIGLLEHVPGAYVAALAVLDRDRTGQATEPTIHELPLGEALNFLVPQMSSLSYLDRGLAKLCSELDDLGGAIALRYSEASELAETVTALLATPRAAIRSDWAAMDVTVNDLVAREAGLYRRATVNDAVRIGNDVSLLLNEEYFVLSGIGPGLWDQLSTWSSMQDLFASLVATYGHSPNAERILAQELDHLVGRGLVEKA